MIHDQIEELLGAYALDATDPEERQLIEAHLAECPRCRAEVQAHQEVAASLASSSSEVPSGLWEKIAVSIAADGPQEAPPSPVLGGNVVRLPVKAPVRGRSLGWGVAAVAAAAVAFLGVTVAHLDNRVNDLQNNMSKSSLADWLLQPHETVTLDSASRSPVAYVVLARSGQAVWYQSSLGYLPADMTYQMWGLSHGQVVSLALMGTNPHQLAPFDLGSATTKIMVTAEPAGGTAKPTTPVVAAGTIPSGYVS